MLRVPGLLGLVGLLGLLGWTACAGGQDVDCASTTPTSLDTLFVRYFAAQPQAPNRGCALPNCHAGGAGGLRFSTAEEFYAATVNVRAQSNSRQRRVDPGDPGRSHLYLRLTPTPPGDRMPVSGPYLDDVALKEVAGWICQGAPPPGATDGGATD